MVCYDELGRPGRKITIAGGTPLDETEVSAFAGGVRLEETAAYDASTGRLDTVHYLSAGTTLRYGYSSVDGRLERIVEGSDRVIWKAEVRNAAGRVTSEMLGFEPGNPTGDATRSYRYDPAATSSRRMA